jgi:DNA polymerase elongation subunit (family B)
MRYIAFDIETGPRPESEIAPLMPEFTAPGNIKDPAKIEAAIAAKKQAWIDNAALDPLSGRILMVGTQADDGHYTPYPYTEQQTEWQIVSDVLRTLGDYAASAHARIIGFNTRQFDIPFLFRRAWILGVNVPVVLREFLTRRNNDQVVDLQDIWLAGAYDRSGQSLKQIALACDLPPKLGDGAAFPSLWASDRKAAIEYNKRDLEITVALAKKLGVIV